MKLTLKDGSVKEYQNPITAAEAAKDLSMGLYRAACAARIDGKVADLRTVLDHDCTLEILTFADEEGQRAFNHTASHILAQAVTHLYPEAKFAIGPAIDNGFYYDFDLPTPFTTEDLEKLEAVVKFTEASGIDALCRLAENLDLFDVVPDVFTEEEYGRYLIQKSGKFAYDQKLWGFYDYQGFGEDRVWQEDGCFTECGYVAYHGTELLEELIPGAPTEEQGMQML